MLLMMLFSISIFAVNLWLIHAQLYATFESSLGTSMDIIVDHNTSNPAAHMTMTVGIDGWWAIGFGNATDLKMDGTYCILVTVSDAYEQISIEEYVFGDHIIGKKIQEISRKPQVTRKDGKIIIVMERNITGEVYNFPRTNSPVTHTAIHATGKITTTNKPVGNTSLINTTIYAHDASQWNRTSIPYTTIPPTLEPTIFYQSTMYSKTDPDDANRDDLIWELAFWILFGLSALMIVVWCTVKVWMKYRDSKMPRKTPEYKDVVTDDATGDA